MFEQRQQTPSLSTADLRDGLYNNEALYHLFDDKSVSTDIKTMP